MAKQEDFREAPEEEPEFAPQPPAQPAQPQPHNPEMVDAYTAADQPYDFSGTADALQQQQQKRIELQNQQVREMTEDPVGEDLRNEMFQRDLRQQSQNTIALQQERLQLEKTRNIKNLLDQHSAINFDLEITPEEAKRRRKDIDTQLRLERARKYTRESYVKRGDAYDPSRFEQVPMYDGDVLVGTARVDVEAYGHRPASIQKGEVEGAATEQKGQMIVFDQDRPPEGLFKTINENGDGERLAASALYYDDMRMLHTRDMSQWQKVLASLEYSAAAGLKFFVEGNQSIAQSLDRTLSWMAGAFTPEGVEAGSLFDIPEYFAANLVENRQMTADIDSLRQREQAIKGGWQIKSDFVNNAYYDDFGTQFGVAVGEGIAQAMQTIALSTILPGGGQAAAGATSLRQAIGRQLLNGPRGMFAAGTASLAYMGRFRAQYQNQGMSLRDAELNAVMDGGMMMTATMLSHALMGKANNWMMQSKAAQQAMFSLARHKVPNLVATGFTREAIQETLEEVMFAGMSAAADRMDWVGEREDGDFAPSARELLLALLAGGTIGGATGGTLDLFQVNKGIQVGLDARRKRGMVGSRAKGVDGQPLIKNEHGEAAKVTEENQAEYERLFEQDIYMAMVKDSLSPVGPKEKDGLVRMIWDQLVASSERLNGKKGLDVEIFGNPNQKVKRGKGRGQRKLDFASLDGALAHAVAGATGNPLVDSELEERGISALEGNSRKDWEKAGLGWMVKGLSRGERSQLIREARNSLGRLEMRNAYIDARAMEIMEEQGMRPDRSPKAMAKAEAQAREEADALSTIENPASFIGTKGDVDIDGLLRAAENPTLLRKADGAKRGPLSPSQQVLVDFVQQFAAKNPDFEVVAAPNSAAGSMQQALAAQGVAVVFVANSGQGQGFRDPKTGIVFIDVMNIAEGEATADAVAQQINGVIAHELIHTLQYEAGITYTELVQRLIEIDPEAMREGAAEYLRRKSMPRTQKALGEARERGELQGEVAGALVSENIPGRGEGPFTDQDLVVMLSQDPTLAREVVPYAIQLLVLRDSDSERSMERLVSAMTNGDQTVARKVYERMRKLYNAIKDGSDLGRAWKDAQAWDALITAMADFAAGRRGVEPTSVLEGDRTVAAPDQTEVRQIAAEQRTPTEEEEEDEFDPDDDPLLRALIEAAEKEDTASSPMLVPVGLMQQALPDKKSGLQTLSDLISAATTTLPPVVLSAQQGPINAQNMKAAALVGLESARQRVSALREYARELALGEVGFAEFSGAIEAHMEAASIVADMESLQRDDVSDPMRQAIADALTMEGAVAGQLVDALVDLGLETGSISQSEADAAIREAKAKGMFAAPTLVDRITAQGVIQQAMREVEADKTFKGHDFDPMDYSLSDIISPNVSGDYKANIVGTSPAAKLQRDNLRRKLGGLPVITEVALNGTDALGVYSNFAKNLPLGTSKGNLAQRQKIAKELAAWMRNHTDVVGNMAVTFPKSDHPLYSGLELEIDDIGTKNASPSFHLSFDTSRKLGSRAKKIKARLEKLHDIDPLFDTARYMSLDDLIAQETHQRRVDPKVSDSRQERTVDDQKSAVWDKMRKRIVNPGGKNPQTALDLLRQYLMVQSFANYGGLTSYADHRFPGVGGHAIAYSVTMAMSTMFFLSSPGEAGKAWRGGGIDSKRNLWYGAWFVNLAGAATLSTGKHYVGGGGSGSGMQLIESRRDVERAWDRLTFDNGESIFDPMHKTLINYAENQSDPVLRALAKEARLLQSNPVTNPSHPLHNIAIRIGDGPNALHGALKPNTPEYQAARQKQSDYYDKIRDNFTKLAREIKPITKKEFDDEIENITQSLANTLPHLEQNIRRSIEIKKELADKGYAEIDTRGVIYIVGSRKPQGRPPTSGPTGSLAEGLANLSGRTGDGLLYLQLLRLEGDISQTSKVVASQMDKLASLFNMMAVSPMGRDSNSIAALKQMKSVLTRTLQRGIYQSPSVAQEKAAVEAFLRSVDLVLELEGLAQQPRSDARDKRIISLFGRIGYVGLSITDKTGTRNFGPENFKQYATEFIRLIQRGDKPNYTKILSMTGFGIDAKKIGEEVGNVDEKLLNISPRSQPDPVRSRQVRTMQGADRQFRANYLNPARIAIAEDSTQTGASTPTGGRGLSIFGDRVLSGPMRRMDSQEYDPRIEDVSDFAAYILGEGASLSQQDLIEQFEFPVGKRKDEHKRYGGSEVTSFPVLVPPLPSGQAEMVHMGRDPLPATKVKKGKLRVEEPERDFALSDKILDQMVVDPDGQHKNLIRFLGDDNKALDEDGNIPLLFHGSQYAGFMSFDPESTMTYGMQNVSQDGMIFMTDDPNVARNYVGSGQAGVVRHERLQTSDNANSIFEQYRNEHHVVGFDTAGNPIFDMRTKRYRARMRPPNTQSVNERNPSAEKGIGMYPFRTFKVTESSTVLPATTLREAAAIIESLRQGQNLPGVEDSVFQPTTAAVAMTRGMSRSEIMARYGDQIQTVYGFAEGKMSQREGFDSTGLSGDLDSVDVLATFDNEQDFVNYFNKNKKAVAPVEGGIYGLVVRMKNPFIIDGDGMPFSLTSFDLPQRKDKNLRKLYDEFDGETIRGVHNAEIAQAARSDGYDGVIIRNSLDAAKRDDNPLGNVASDIYIAFNNKQVKSPALNSGMYDVESPRIDEALLEPRQAIKILQREFLSRGELPRAVFEKKFTRDAEMKRASELARMRNAQLRKAINGQAKDKAARDALVGMVDTAIKSNDFSELKGEVRYAAMQMRHSIDDYTKKLLDTGAITGGLEVTLRSNMGFYVHRSYRVFDDPDWSKKVPRDVRNRMKAVLRTQFPRSEGESERDYENRIETHIERLLFVGQDSGSAIDAMTKGLGVDPSIFKKRKDFEPALMALWGEYKDPYINFTKTIEKIASFAANYKFMTEVHALGTTMLGRDDAALFYPVDHPDRPPSFQAQFPMDTVRYDGLAGMYTSPEFMDALKMMDDNDTVDQWWYRSYLRANSAIKWGKTVGSPMTHARNMVGNVFFALANGQLFSPTRGAESVAETVKVMPGLATFLAALQGKSKEEIAQAREEAEREYLRLVELGVVQSGNINEVLDLLQKAQADGLTADQLLDDLITKGGAAAVAGKVAKTALEGAKHMNRLYMAEDDVWKVFAYAYEKSRYEKAYADAGQPIPADLDEIIARIVRDTYPNYDMVPRFIRRLRQFPFAGTFVSFPSEVIRTAINRAIITQRELRDPALRNIGVSRLAGQFSAYVLVQTVANALSALWGFDEEEMEALRSLVAPWSQNSPLIAMRDSDGSIKYIDLGYTDPHSMFLKPLIALARGGDVQTAIFGNEALGQRGALHEIMEPFFGEEILFGSLIEAYRNRTDTGRPIYSAGDQMFTKWGKVAEHLGGDLAPGFYKQLLEVPYKSMRGITDDFGRVFDLPTHMISVATGFKREPIDIKQAFSFKTRTFARAENELRGELSKLVGRAGTVSEAEISTDYARINTAREQLHFAFNHRVQLMRRLGVSDQEIFNILYEGGLARKHIPGMLSGEYQPLNLDTKYLRRYMTRAAAANPDAPILRQGEMRERIRALRQAEAEARNK